jgi:hypothetical protein
MPGAEVERPVADIWWSIAGCQQRAVGGTCTLSLGWCLHSTEETAAQQLSRLPRRVFRSTHAHCCTRHAHSAARGVRSAGSSQQHTYNQAARRNLAISTGRRYRHQPSGQTPKHLLRPGSHTRPQASLPETAIMLANQPATQHHRHTTAEPADTRPTPRPRHTPDP